MVARFFVDENDLALGKALAGRYGNVFYPGHPDLPEVPRQSADDVWLEVVGAERLVVVTRDKRIRYRPIERRRWIEHAVRGFVLTGKASQSTIDSLALLGQRWDEVMAIVDAHPEGPWCTPSPEPVCDKSCRPDFSIVISDGEVMRKRPRVAPASETL